MDVTRREILHLAGAAGAAAVVSPAPSLAQSPKRGGVFRVRGEEPTGFDPHLTLSYKTMTALSFSHSRLLKVKAGPSVKPGTLPLEGDLAESWSQTSPTTYVFKLRRDVRWHPKPPVNGRELTADDVKYTYERFLTVKGNPNYGTLEQIEKVEAPDKSTIRITLKQPYAWFLDMIASTSTWIVAREAVERTGDLKRPDACVGTGPWMLDRYEPNRLLTYVRNPNYFLPGLPYADGVELTMDEDPSSRFGKWISGAYDFAPEYGMIVRQLDLDMARQRRPRLQTATFTVGFGGITWMKHDREPLKDIRVRRALAMATSWKDVIDANAYSNGHGVPNPAVPAAFSEWSIPIDQLPPEGRRLYEHDPKEAKRLLTEAGYGSGLKVALDVTPAFGPDFMDAVQLSLGKWKAVGVDTDLRLKEYGAFISSTIFGRFDNMAGTLFGSWTDPESYLVRYHLPGQITNASGVNDPKVTEMIQLQRRTFDVAKRREIIHDIQRYLSQQVYHLYGPSPIAVAAWEPYVRDFAPNIGFDVGGRLQGAWLDR
jgi:peptide/nickel transport system substrate-binding protein